MFAEGITLTHSMLTVSTTLQMFFAFLSLFDTLHLHLITSRFFNISILKCVAEEALLIVSRA